MVGMTSDARRDATAARRQIFCVWRASLCTMEVGRRCLCAVFHETPCPRGSEADKADAWASKHLECFGRLRFRRANHRTLAENRHVKEQ